jgi:hypothetical protein
VYATNDGIEMRAEATGQIDVDGQGKEQRRRHKRISEDIGLSWIEAYGI